MSITDHLGLFKADWISDPERLKTLARRSKYNDLFTAEIAAWCAEIHEHLRELALRAAERVSVRVSVIAGSAEALPAREGEFDAAAVPLVLCSVPDQDVALREIQRVLHADAELRFYEHVIARHPRAARVQRILDATIYPYLTGGCHCARDTGTAIRRAGFQIEHEERIAFKPSPLTPAIPHILGTARRP